jgi:uncharacterized protein (DUF58 family)
MKLGYHLLYRIYRWLSGTRYWMTRHFSRAGLAVAAGVFVTSFFGVDPEFSVGYQALSLLLGMLLVAMLFSFRFTFKDKFEAERVLPRFGTAGQPFTYRMVLRNLTGRNQNGLVVLDQLADTRPKFEQWRRLQVDDNKYTRSFSLKGRRRNNPFVLATIKEATAPLLPPRQTTEVTIEFTPLRRGVVHFAGVTLARTDPLGLMRALRKVPMPQAMLILPQRYHLPPFALPGALKYQQGGVAMASNVGQSDEFVALREYRRGDPVRHIHWRSWARTGKPIVKEFEDEFFVRHALILDTFTDRPYTEEFEAAVSVAASFACTVLTQESLLDLLFVERQAFSFTAGRGLAHADQMLEILASVQPSTQPFDVLDELIVNHASLVSGCICVFLDWDEKRQRLVEKLKVLRLPVLVLVVRPPGADEPLQLGPMRTDPERLISLPVGKVEEQLAKLK